MFCFYQVSNKYLMQLVSLALAHAFLFFFFPVLDPFETGGVGKQGEREKKKKETQPPSATNYMAALFSSAAKTQLI